MVRQILFFSMLACANNVFAQQAQPNVVLIAIDDLNTYIGCMGGEAKTPNMDRLAAKGVLFTNAYCAAPACNPSRVAIMTGMRPERTGQYTNQGNFRDIGNNQQLLTLPQKFMQAGYETLAGGKIFHMPAGVGAKANEQSDPQSWTRQVMGNTGTSTPPGVYLTSAGVAKWLADDTLAYTKGKTVDYLAKASIWGATPQKKEQSGDWKMSMACADYVKDTHDKPFFFAIGFSKPHQPLMAPKEFMDMYPLHALKMKDWPADDMNDIPAINQKNFSSAFVAKIREHNQLLHAYQAYLACVSFVDACIGNVLNAIEQGPNASNTIVVLFSDHGFQLGDKNRWEKYSLWRLATRAPMMIYAPGYSNGQVCTEQVSLMDIHATLLELCGITTTSELDALSLKNQLTSAGARKDLPAIVTHEEGNNSILLKGYNYIRYKDGSEELYNHARDGDERKNLIGTKEAEPVVAELRHYIPKVVVRQGGQQKKTMGTLE